MHSGFIKSANHIPCTIEIQKRFFIKDNKSKHSIDSKMSAEDFRSNRIQSTKLPLNLKDYHDFSRNAMVFGKNRGLQGNKDSCYLDTLLMAMFAFTSVFDFLLYRPKRDYDIKKYIEIQETLKNDIVDALRM
jgi:hypothetical protein